ncbi:sodium ion-translocating decarboxylase subunit beta, partial [Halomonas nitroreducens]
MTEKILTLWYGSGLYNLSLGQAVMLAVGLLLLWLAMAKKFEPLLLVPIGFGGILANIPEAGLALSAAEQAAHLAGPELLERMAAALQLSLDPAAGVEAWRHTLTEVLHGDTPPELVRAANDVAKGAGHAPGMLYQFYSVAIASGVAPLVIFMGVGAMTDFGPLLANPRTLFLGAAAQFGIFA